MDGDTIYVVGDHFATITRSQAIMPISELESLVDNADAAALDGQTYVMGLGVASERVETLKEKMMVRAPGCRVTAESTTRAQQRLIDAQKDHFVLVSVPERQAADRFRLRLLLGDNQRERRADEPRKRLQEAARQALLAVTEQYYLDAQGDNRTFVIQRIAVEGATGPLPPAADISYHVEIVRQNDLGAYFFSVHMVFENESGAEIASAEATFATYPVRVGAGGEVFYDSDEEIVARVPAVPKPKVRAARCQ